MHLKIVWLRFKYGFYNKRVLAVVMIKRAYYVPGCGLFSLLRPFLRISLGENILVSNQIEVIERMEIKLTHQRRIKEPEEKILSLQKIKCSYVEDKLYPIILQDILWVIR